MNSTHFNIMMDKLEEIRCEIVDVEAASEKTSKDKVTLNIVEFRENFFSALDRKTGWGKNELKELFNAVVNSTR